MSLYRNTVWFFKGLKEYTKNGYASASKNFNEADLKVNCTGQHYMITGANSGIGKCIATEIAKLGGTVHMVCRNPTAAEEARKEIIEASENQNVFVHLLDISKPRDVYNFAKDFCDQNENLHVLINNAGCMFNTQEMVEESLEKNFATNTLGTYILTTNLIPVMKKSEKSRVIVVSSGGMLVQRLNTEDLNFDKMKPFDGTLAYAQNKRQQVVMVEQFAKLHPEIHFSCMHPGWANTPAVHRRPVDTHLPLASTKVSTKDEEKLMFIMCMSIVVATRRVERILLATLH
ncbi:Dehydrogenase/reductase SDR family member 12-like 2, partial [Homarus americanus]